MYYYLRKSYIKCVYIATFEVIRKTLTAALSFHTHLNYIAVTVRVDYYTARSSKKFCQSLWTNVFVASFFISWNNQRISAIFCIFIPYYL